MRRMDDVTSFADLSRDVTKPVCALEISLENAMAMQGSNEERIDNPDVQNNFADLLNTAMNESIDIMTVNGSKTTFIVIKIKS